MLTLQRPGPYINAEVSGGGFPGWLQRNPGILRSSDADYLNATNNYVKSISEIIAKGQITNGGPVILLQPENEYTTAVEGIVFPDAKYMAYVENQYRSAGIVVPFLSNDAGPDGHNAPGQPAPVDIYGHDGYPLGFNCAEPYTWGEGDLPTNYRVLHEMQSPNTPYSITEFQGGSFDPWGGVGFGQCTAFLGPEFERVFYKNDFSFHVAVFNLYMTYGGTNWGNLGYPVGYTSYDYGAVITEDFQVNREKYSEAKLEANGMIAFGDAYLTASPAAAQATWYTGNADLTVTPLQSNKTQFFIIIGVFDQDADFGKAKLDRSADAPRAIGDRQFAVRLRDRRRLENADRIDARGERRVGHIAGLNLARIAGVGLEGAGSTRRSSISNSPGFGSSRTSSKMKPEKRGRSGRGKGGAFSAGIRTV